MTGPLSAWRAWQERRSIFRDLRRAAADTKERNHFKVQDQLIFANSALDNNDHVQATEIWNKLAADYPPTSLQSLLALKVLMRLRRYDEATTLMRDAHRRIPNEPKFLQGLGQIAQAKNDHDEALKIYAQMRKRFPGAIEGYTSAAESLITKHRLDEAEDLSRKAQRQFHLEIAPHLGLARIAVLRGDWEEALRRWQPVCDQFDHVIGTVGTAHALTRLGRYEEAEDLLQKARYRFGSEPGPLSEYARVAEAKGNTSEAVQRWKDVLYRFPLEQSVYIAASEALEKLGEPAEAEATLRAAVDRFPTDLHPMLWLAKLLQIKHQNFPSAAEAWAAIRGVFPDFEEAYTNGAESLRQAGRIEEADALRAEYQLRAKSR